MDVRFEGTACGVVVVDSEPLPRIGVGRWSGSLVAVDFGIDDTKPIKMGLESSDRVRPAEAVTAR